MNARTADQKPTQQILANFWIGIWSESIIRQITNNPYADKNDT